MSLRLYNTLTRTKEEFRPLDPRNVRMYVCGPTVYDYAHIGNARPVIVFDVLFRLLRQFYGEAHVTYVRNITDVDDKINARAREEGVSIRSLTERTAEQFHADIKALGVLPPTVEPRATEHIAEMIAIIERLIAAGHAYAADGHVLFDVPSMKDYGQLSRRSLDEMVAGARVDVAPYKRGDMDFVLWKPSDADTPGWDSPWGRGRPGWHIECSAMSWKHLGEVFDIHGGGIDLVFPHHENEIAQTRCAFGHNVMANVWMHNGFLQVEGQKMSKSLGNFVTINQLLNRSSMGPLAGVVLRLAMMGTHYRDPIDWTYSKLRDARSRLSIWNKVIGNNWDNLSLHNLSSDVWSNLKPPSKEIIDALCDDLNTPLALTRLSELYPLADLNEGRGVLQLLSDLSFLGLASKDSMYFGHGVVGRGWPDNSVSEMTDLAMSYRVAVANSNPTLSETIASQLSRLGYSLSDRGFLDVTVNYVGAAKDGHTVEQLIESRTEARKAKDWAESDRIRDELARMGIAIKDNKDGTTSWEVKR